MKHLPKRIYPNLRGAAWREQYDFLAELTPQRCLELFNLWRRGDYSDVQLVWDTLEEFDDVLGTVIERRRSALLSRKWGINIDAERVGNDAALQQLADEQVQLLTKAWNRIVNFNAAISHLASASFRGYAHLEKVILPSGDIKLEPVDQWYWARPERRGNWYFNPAASSGWGNLYDADASDLIVRCCERPINIVAMCAICVKQHAESGWDGFLDVFGNPSLFFEMPQGTTDEEAEEYARIVMSIIGDGRGTIPAGGKVIPIESKAENATSFAERVKFANEKMILRATGGLLTMLAESGSGTLAGGAHQESFDLIAQSEGKEIAEDLHEQYFAPILEEAYPDQPKLAYFDCVIDEVEDTNAIVTQIVSLAGAGYQTPVEQICEKTGYNVEYVAPVMPSPMAGMPLSNRGVTPALLTNSTSIPSATRPAEEEELSPDELGTLKALLASPSDADIANLADALKSPLAGALQVNPSNDPKTIANAKCNAVATPQNGDAEDGGDDDILENGECRSKTGTCRVHNPKPREPKTKSGQSNPYTAPSTANDKVKEKAINKAIARVRKTNKPIHGVISKDGIGKIDIKPGNAGSAKRGAQRKNAHGLQHVDQKHPEMKGKLGRTIVKGTVTPDAKHPTRKNIKDGSHKVVVEHEINKGSGRTSKTRAKIHTAFKSRSNNEPRK